MPDDVTQVPIDESVNTAAPVGDAGAIDVAADVLNVAADAATDATAGTAPDADATAGASDVPADNADAPDVAADVPAGDADAATGNPDAPTNDADAPYVAADAPYVAAGTAGDADAIDVAAGAATDATAGTAGDADAIDVAAGAATDATAGTDVAADAPAGDADAATGNPDAPAGDAGATDVAAGAATDATAGTDVAADAPDDNADAVDDVAADAPADNADAATDATAGTDVAADDGMDPDIFDPEPPPDDDYDPDDNIPVQQDQPMPVQQVVPVQQAVPLPPTISIPPLSPLPQPLFDVFEWIRKDTSLCISLEPYTDTNAIVYRAVAYGSEYYNAYIQLRCGVGGPQPYQLGIPYFANLLAKACMDIYNYEILRRLTEASRTKNNSKMAARQLPAMITRPSSAIAAQIVKRWGIIKLFKYNAADEKGFPIMRRYDKYGRFTGIWDILDTGGDRDALAAILRGLMGNAASSTDISNARSAILDDLYSPQMAKENTMIMRLPPHRELIWARNGVIDCEHRQFWEYTHPDFDKLFGQYVRFSKLDTDFVRNAPMPADFDVEQWVRDLFDTSTPEGRASVNILWTATQFALRQYKGAEKNILFLVNSGSDSNARSAGHNGKSTFEEMLKYVFASPDSDRQTTSNGPKVLNKPLESIDNRFGATPKEISSAMVWLIDEINARKYVENDRTLKNLAREQAFECEEKGKQSQMVTFYGMVICASNDVPKIRADSDSATTHQIYLAFEKDFSANPRPEIKNDYIKRRETSEYILWRAANMPFMTDYDPRDLDAVSGNLRAMRKTNNPTYQFLDEYLPGLIFEEITTPILYLMYSNWCSSNNMQPKGAINFTKDIQTWASNPDLGGKWFKYESSGKVPKAIPAKKRKPLIEFHQPSLDYLAKDNRGKYISCVATRRDNYGAESLMGEFVHFAPSALSTSAKVHLVNKEYDALIRVTREWAQRKEPELGDYAAKIRADYKNNKHLDGEELEQQMANYLIRAYTDEWRAEITEKVYVSWTD